MAVYSEVQMPRFDAENLPLTLKKLYNTGQKPQNMLRFMRSGKRLHRSAR